MILVDATPLQTEHRYRGIGTYTAGLLDAMTRLDPRPPIGLLCQEPHPADLPLLHELLARSGVSAVLLRRPRWCRSRLAWLVSALTVTPTVWRFRPRLYHATEGNGLVCPPAALAVAAVATIHDFIPLRDAAARLRRLDDRIGYARYVRLVKRADRLIANSEATKRDAVERLRIAPERIAVTPLAVDPGRFHPCTPEEVTATVARYGLRRPYFFHVGSSDPNKNTANILAAFDIFRRNNEADHALYIAGTWPPQALDTLARTYPALVESGRVRVLGFVPHDDLPALYSGAEAFVYPSRHEGFGLPVLEAMRCATPVLTSNTSSLPEVAGDAALYVAPADAAAIAAALRRLAAAPALRADLVSRGLRQAEMFSWSRTAQQTLQVYAEVLAASSTRLAGAS